MGEATTLRVTTIIEKESQLKKDTIVLQRLNQATGAVVEIVKMRDDGTGTDDIADDNTFTGVVNLTATDASSEVTLRLAAETIEAGHAQSELFVDVIQGLTPGTVFEHAGNYLISRDADGVLRNKTSVETRSSQITNSDGVVFNVFTTYHVQTSGDGEYALILKFEDSAPNDADELEPQSSQLSYESPSARLWTKVPKDSANNRYLVPQSGSLVSADGNAVLTVEFGDGQTQLNVFNSDGDAKLDIPIELGLVIDAGIHKGGDCVYLEGYSAEVDPGNTIFRIYQVSSSKSWVVKTSQSAFGYLIPIDAESGCFDFYDRTGLVVESQVPLL